jgi:hypothetical protein
MCQLEKLAHFGAPLARRFAGFSAILGGKVLAQGAIPRALWRASVLLSR